MVLTSSGVCLRSLRQLLRYLIVPIGLDDFRVIFMDIVTAFLSCCCIESPPLLILSLRICRLTKERCAYFYSVLRIPRYDPLTTIDVNMDALHSSDSISYSPNFVESREFRLTVRTWNWQVRTALLSGFFLETHFLIGKLDRVCCWFTSLGIVWFCPQHYARYV